MTPALKARIEKLLKDNPTLLFMKGTPEQPMCGFSARAVQILNHMDAPFGSVNILDDMELREGLKEYAQWPTFPQLYVGGELLGGCDIMTEMYQSGELHDALGIKLPSGA
jgi:monothiol glutaredoxin